MPIDPQNLARWRLILGKSAEEPLQRMGNCVGQPILGGDQNELDEALEAIYSGHEIDKDEWESGDKRVGPHGAVKGRTFPKVAKWLDQIRNFFPRDVVVLLQKDAIERRGLKQLLFEPEILANVEPSIYLASTVLAMKNMVPEKAKSAARSGSTSRGRSSQAPRIAIHPGHPRALLRNRHSPFRSLLFPGEQDNFVGIAPDILRAQVDRL